MQATCFNTEGSFECSCNTGYGPAGFKPEATTQMQKMSSLGIVSVLSGGDGVDCSRLVLIPKQMQPLGANTTNYISVNELMMKCKLHVN
jgi:hypothetical protein